MGNLPLFYKLADLYFGFLAYSTDPDNRKGDIWFSLNSPRKEELRRSRKDEVIAVSHNNSAPENSCLLSG